jgi:site-specific DNA recombinase
MGFSISWGWRITMTPNLPISALIARVSLEKQAKNGYSLETQIKIMSEINAREGYATNPEYVLQDDGYSGDDWDRPAINKGLELMRQGKISGLTFMETDRFARDTAGGLELIKKVVALGGAVILGDLGRVRDEGNFRLMLTVKLAIAEFQKTSIRVKSRDAVITKVQRGEIHGGRAPYGYIYLDKIQGSKLIINEEQAKIVRKIFKWYDNGWSCRRIVRQLTADGVPAPGRPRKDGIISQWDPGFISTMIRNETYIGFWHYNKHRSVEPAKVVSTKPRHRKRTTQLLKNRAEWISIRVPELIDQPTFERCKLRAASNINSIGGRPSDRYLLRGLLWCSCGHRMHGERHSKTHRDTTQPRGADDRHPTARKGVLECFYRCSNQSRSTSERYCQTKIKAEPIEELVWKETTAILSDEALLRRLLLEHDQKSGAKVGERTKLQQRIEELFRKEMRYRSDSGAVTGSRAEETRQHYAQLIRETQSQREILEWDLAKSTPVKDRVDVSALVAAVRKKAATLNRGERQELLQRWVSKVEYDGGEVTIDLRIPLVGKSAQNCPGELDHSNSFAPLTIVRRLAA